MTSRKWTYCAAAGLSLAALLAYFTGNGEQLMHSYLTSICFVTSLSLGALFFVVLQHLTKSKWSVVLRRPAEIMAAATPWLLLLYLPLLLAILWGDSNLYSWNDAELVAHDEIVAGKAPFLNGPFFAARALLYFTVWGVIANFFWRCSIRQDQTGDVDLTLRMQRWSGPAMIAFALTSCFAAFDWLMSLDPHWFSTIFGVYFFSGAVVGFLAALTLCAIILERGGRLPGITTEHFHDLGKLQFGFVFFWGYIAFSQYLLIWYANIPEETSWFATRQSGGWGAVSLLLLFGHLLLPFCGLMSRAAKRSRASLAAWSTWLLLMHWLDLYWIVMPSYAPSSAPNILLDLLVLLGVSAIYLAVLMRLKTNISMIPIRDPRLSQSLAFHNA